MRYHTSKRRKQSKQVETFIKSSLWKDLKSTILSAAMCSPTHGLHTSSGQGGHGKPGVQSLCWFDFFFFGFNVNSGLAGGFGPWHLNVKDKNEEQFYPRNERRIEVKKLMNSIHWQRNFTNNDLSLHLWPQGYSSSQISRHGGQAP